ncbi:MAG: hypothetical protein M0C28_37090 [Candidatus Moduliflexus flocculans]|nr:hypothetical protein [Candidatus Moduliflexus flocculans]
MSGSGTSTWRSRSGRSRSSFCARIVEGGASHSYGIQVARLAGLPAAVIERAKEILHNLEAGEFETGAPRLAKSRSRRSRSPRSLGLFEQVDDPLRQRLEEIDISVLTPLKPSTGSTN